MSTESPTRRGRTRSRRRPDVTAAEPSIRELVVDLALVQYALRRETTQVENAVLMAREQDTVEELRGRDLLVSCHRTVSLPQH